MIKLFHSIVMVNKTLYADKDLITFKIVNVYGRLVVFYLNFFFKKNVKAVKEMVLDFCIQCSHKTIKGWPRSLVNHLH